MCLPLAAHVSVPEVHRQDSILVAVAEAAGQELPGVCIRSGKALLCSTLLRRSSGVKLSARQMAGLWLI